MTHVFDSIIILTVLSEKNNTCDKTNRGCSEVT